MTTPEDPVLRPDGHQPGEFQRAESLLTATLDRHAGEAPADHTLLSTVQRRLRRRRTGRAVGVAVLACAVVAVAATVGQTLTNDVMPPPNSGKTADVAAKAGWRWESYKNVQVQVPAKWDNYVSGPAPCPGFSGNSPTVGRFSPWQGGRLTCGVAVLPLADRHEYLWFDDVQKPGVKKYDGGWTEETRDIDGVHVSVLTRDDALRREILDSAVAFNGRDAYGCESAISDLDRSGLPPTNLGTVSAVDICEYWGGGVSRPPAGPLIAGTRLVGQRAGALAKALSQPQSTKTLGNGCSDDGGRTYELTVHGTNGSWHGAFALSGCSVDPYSTMFKLIRTGVHNPAEPSKLIDLPGSFVPPER